jgi:hypothetical protein
MAYKDYMKTENKDTTQEVDAMFFSRPLVLPNGAFGALNFFFDPTDISPQEIESLGILVADFLDNYWEQKEQKSRVTN